MYSNDVPDGIQKDQKNDLEEIASMTPFSAEELGGLQFRRGNMLGGASPLESSVDFPQQ